MAVTTVQAFLDGISAALGLPGLRFNQDSVCCMFVPGELEVQIEWVPSEQLFMLLSPLSELGDDSDGKLARALLESNFLFSGTRGETLSVESETGRIFLCARIDAAQVSPDHAVELFARFVDTATLWRKHLESGAAGAGVERLPAGQGFLKG